MNEKYIPILLGVAVFIFAFLLQLIFCYIPMKLRIRKYKRKGRLMRLRVVEVKGPSDNVTLLCEDVNNNTYKITTDMNQKKWSNVYSSNRVHVAVLRHKGVFLLDEEYLAMLDADPSRAYNHS